MTQANRSNASQEQPSDSVEIEVHTDRTGNVPISTVIALMKRVRELEKAMARISVIAFSKDESVMRSGSRFDEIYGIADTALRGK